MSDQVLAELRRRVAQGEPHARVQLVQQRLRVGELDPDRVRLAAYVGDPDARTFGIDGVPASANPWFRGILRWGPVALVRSGLAVLRLVNDSLADSTRHALLGLEAWAACPCDEHAAAAERRVAFAAEDGGWYSAAKTPEFSTVTIDCLAAASLHPLLGALRNRFAPELAQWTTTFFVNVSEQQMRAAVRAEVAPWALGERDVLRERVETAERRCSAIVTESPDADEPWPAPRRCGQPGTYWRGPTSLRSTCCCPEHEPTNPTWFQVSAP